MSPMSKIHAPGYTHFNRHTITAKENPLMSDETIPATTTGTPEEDAHNATESESITSVAEDITFDTIIEDEDGEAELPDPEGADEEPDEPDNEALPTVENDEDNAPD